MWWYKLKPVAIGKAQIESFGFVCANILQFPKSIGLPLPVIGFTNNVTRSSA